MYATCMPCVFHMYTICIPCVFHVHSVCVRPYVPCVRQVRFTRIQCLLHVLPGVFHVNAMCMRCARGVYVIHVPCVLHVHCMYAKPNLLDIHKSCVCHMYGIAHTHAIFSPCVCGAIYNRWVRIYNRWVRMCAKYTWPTAKLCCIRLHRIRMVKILHAYCIQMEQTQTWNIPGKPMAYQWFTHGIHMTTAHNTTGMRRTSNGNSLASIWNPLRIHMAHT